MKIESEAERLDRLADEYVRLNERQLRILEEVKEPAQKAWYRCKALRCLLQAAQARIRSCHETIEREVYEQLAAELLERSETVIRQHPWIRKDFPA
jgi:ElaB/YqjD/DUF883 family membrane-anchored ribosome-binding protein